MSDNHAVHFTNALVRHVQRTEQMATLFRAAKPAALTTRSASFAAPAGALPIQAANTPAIMPAPLPVPFKAALDRQAAPRLWASEPMADPSYGMPTPAPATAQHLAHAPAADYSPHVVTGAQSALGAVAGVSAHLAQPIGVDVGASEPPGSLASRHAVREGDTPTSIVERARLHEPNQSGNQPPSGETGDTTWHRLRAIVQAHSAARQAQLVAASPLTSSAQDALDDAVRGAAQRAQAELAPTAGPEALARLETTVRPTAPPPVEQLLPRRMSVQHAPEPSTAQPGHTPQATGSAQAVFEQAQDQHIPVADDWHPLQWAVEDRTATALAEGEMQTLPLQAAWPVEHTVSTSADLSGMSLSEATHSGRAGSGAPEVSAAWPQEELAESLHAVLAPIATGQPTSSPVDIVTPRRLRPAASPQVVQHAPASAPTSDASGVLRAAHEQSERTAQSLSSFAAPATPMPLPRGENAAVPPADLWRLIGLEPPVAAELPTAAVDEVPAASASDAAVAPAPQLHRQASAASPVHANDVTAGRVTSPPSFGAGRNSARGAGVDVLPGSTATTVTSAVAGLLPASDGRAQPSSTNLDLDSLAQAVYARLHRCFLADRERARIR